MKFKEFQKVILIFILLTGINYYVSKNIYFIINILYFVFIVDSKYLALDFHEERKWKRAFACVYAQNARNEFEEKIKKKKIDDLYKKCYSIYFAINHGNNTSEFSEDTKKSKLNEYLNPNFSNEHDNMEKEINNWKKQIKDLENKLKSNIQIEGIYLNGFLDIFSLIKSIINNQEEKLKEMKNTNKNNDTENYALPGSLSDFANLLRDSNNLMIRENKNCTIIADKSNINYNKVNLNIREIIKQVIDEFNKQVLKVDETNITNYSKQNSNIENSNNNNLSNNNNFNNQDLPTIKNYNNSNKNLLQNLGSQNELEDSYKENLNIYQIEQNEFNDFESKLNNGFNPSKLILNITDEINEEDLVECLRSNLGIDNCFILPQYNFEKIMNTKFDLNSVEFDSKNAYYNIFHMIENDEKKLAARKLVEELEFSINNSITNINKLKKINSDYEQNTRYELLTPLQKLIILYGIFTTGNNPYLINCILNAYLPTHCMMYSIDEMNFICKKILEEVGIEYESGFCNIKDEMFNFDKNSKFCLTDSQKVDIESSIFISEYRDFEYNNTIRKIFSIKDDNNKEEYNQIFNNIKNRDQYKLNCDFNIKNKNMSIQRSKILTNIITQNPYINNKEIKKKFLSQLLEYLKDLCEKIQQFQQNNKSKFNYFTGEQVSNGTKQINDLNYKEIIENKNRKLDKNDVLRQLRKHKNETFSIKKRKHELIKKQVNDEEKIKEKIVSVINPYCELNIKNEWEKMRKVWYQNNQRFNPIFKLNDKISENIRKMSTISNLTTDNSYRSNPGNNGGNEGGNIFMNVQGIKTNQ